MRKAVFIFLIMILAGANFFLFRENRRLTRDVADAKKEANLQKTKLEKAGRNIQALDLFFRGVAGDSKPELAAEFEKAVSETGDEEITSQFEEAKSSRSAEKLIDFAGFVAAKSKGIMSQ